MTEPFPLDRVKLDLDRKWTSCGWVRWCERVAGTLKILDLEPSLVLVRETRRGFHVELLFPKALPSPIYVVAVQAALGSDGVREAFNIRRAWMDTPGAWNVLFVRKVLVNSDGSIVRSVVRPKLHYERILRRKIAEKFHAPHDNTRAVAPAARETNGKIRRRAPSPRRPTAGSVAVVSSRPT